MLVALMGSACEPPVHPKTYEVVISSSDARVDGIFLMIASPGLRRVRATNSRIASQDQGLQRLIFRGPFSSGRVLLEATVDGDVAPPQVVLLEAAAGVSHGYVALQTNLVSISVLERAN